MKHLIQLFILIALFLPSLHAQRVDETIADYTTAHPTEQAYLHIDNSLYSGGDTVWFKAYVLANALPSAFSTNLYADWYDTSGKLIAHQTYPILQGRCNGQFFIPKNYPGSRIQLLAYTKWMLNGENDFLFHKTINIIPAKAPPKQEPETAKTILQFFPEGGNLIAGVLNKVAFKATDQYGSPVSITGQVKDNNSSPVTSFASAHDGMGYFYLTPAAGVNYVAEYGSGQAVSLPAAQPSGIAMEVAVTDSSRKVTIRKKANESGNLNHIHLLATINGTVAYLSNINLSAQDSITSDVAVSALPTGVITFTVLDSNWNPLAERISFIRAADIDTDMPQLSITKKNLGKKGLNTIALQYADSVEANLSVAITDANIAADTTNNITSYLLLTGQLKGKINNAAYYFQSSSIQTQQELDLVMLTNGWRKYNWHAVATNTAPAFKFPKDSAYFFLQGNITNHQNKLPQKISFMAKGGGAFGLYSFAVKKDGSFGDSTMIIYDTASLAYRPEKHMEDLEFNYAVLPEAVYKAYPFPLQNHVTKAEQNMQVAMPDFYKNTLLDVVVKTTIKKYDSPIDSIEDKYESPIFRNAQARKTVYVADQAILSSYGANLSGFIYARLGINIDGATHPTFFVDEQMVPYDAALQVQIDNIVLMKFYKYLVAAPGGGGLKGNIAIYTKRGFEGVKQEASTPSAKIVGYTISEEFYSPDYSTEKNDGSISDHRKTLYWNPQVGLDSKDNKSVQLSFYNNDFANRLRVVIEGIKADGTPIHIEKVLE